MQTLYTSEIFEVQFDEANKLLVSKFITDDYVDEQEFYDNLLQLIPFLKQKIADKAIVDTKNVTFPVTDEIINWILQNITPHFVENDIKRVAYILPTDILSRTGLEFFVEKLFASTPQIERMIFDDEQKAMEWILRK